MYLETMNQLLNCRTRKARYSMEAGALLMCYLKREMVQRGETGTVKRNSGPSVRALWLLYNRSWLALYGYSLLRLLISIILVTKSPVKVHSRTWCIVLVAWSSRPSALVYQ
jgi:hypothetical protein